MLENQNQLSPKFSWNHSIGAQILYLKKDLISSPTTFNEIDLSSFNFSPPLLAIHFATKIAEKRKEIREVQILNSNSYLDTIRFPNGINPTEEFDWEDVLNSFKGKTYLPIIKFPIDHSKVSSDLREAILNHTLSSIRNMTGIPVNYYSGVSYLISELTDNLVDHSESDFGFLMFQYYPSEKIMDICIGDKGIGVLGAYQSYSGEKDYSHIKNHVDAVNAAIKGLSTKNIPERGFGFASSRSILTDGLSGNFLFFSGNALLLDKKLVDFNAHFSGTIALIRIPLQTFSKEFDVIRFTE